MSQEHVVEVEALQKFFPVRSGLLGRTRNYVKAVNGLTFSIAPRETLGIVGESGCGKTTLGRTILRLTNPTGGRIFYSGRDITKLRKKEMKPIRKEMQIVFQDPYSALHPRRMVEDIIAEPLEIHRAGSKEFIKDKVLRTAESVGLSADHLQRYPHELSGGQRQRVVIARALILDPRFLVLDEPTSSLDASVQALILNLLKKLQAELGLTYLLISHHMSVVEHLSDRIGVMYLGKMVELGPSISVFSKPLHPYTQALLASVPQIAEDERGKLANAPQGDVPSPINPPSGCSFHTRCPYARERCSQEEPLLRDADRGRLVACHFFEEIEANAGRP